MVLFKIKNVSIKHKGILAPMQEYTHLPFRLTCKHYKAGLTVTEMVSTRAILEHQEDLSRLSLLSSCKEEGPVAVQLFGNFSERALSLKAGHLLDNYKHFDIIDLNLGCPSLKIINSKAGAYNLKQFEKVLPIIEELATTCKKPITIKTRLGFSKNELDKNLSKLLSTKISAIAVHGRYAPENYSVPSRVDEVYSLKKKCSIPLIYNGDVSENNLEKYIEFDAVMVARASLGNPFIFKQIDYFSNNNMLLKKEEPLEGLSVFLKEVSLNPISFDKLKLSLISFFKGGVGFSKIREELSAAKSISSIKEVLGKRGVQL